MEDVQKSLDDLENKLVNENKSPKKLKLTIAILIIFIIFLLAGFIIILIYFTINQKNSEKKEEEKEKEKEDNSKSEEDYLLAINGFKEEWYDIYGNRTINISYLENDVIPNTFKKGGANYIEELGDLNNGKNYAKHDVNVYDLYIPYSSLSRKNMTNGIILFVHGGGFENNTKAETECFAVRFAKLGFITANIEYTNSLDKYKERGIFRILDEITACIKSIKNELVSQNFDGNKLLLGLYGISAGGELILTYAFSDNNKILPIKFLFNSVGVVSINSTYWYKPAVKNVTLDSIESLDDIEQAKLNKNIVPIDPRFVLHITNLMTGKKLTQEELDKLFVNGELNINDEKYKEMYKYAKYGSPIELIRKKDNKDLIPILCLYGGNDDLIGVGHYSLLRQAYIDKNEKNKIELVYMKYGGHERFHHGTEHDIIAMKEMHAKMVEYAQKYFTSD